MAQLNRQEFDRLTGLLNNPDDPEAAAFKDPQTRAFAEELLGEFAEETIETVTGDDPTGIRALTQAPGAVANSVTTGAHEALYGLGIFAADLAGGMIHEDNADLKVTLKRQREEMVSARNKLEVDHKAAVEQLPAQLRHGVAGFMVNSAPKFAGEVAPFMYLPTGLSTYWRTVGYNGVVGAVGASAFDKDAQNFRDRFGTMTIGGLAGTVLSAALHMPGGFRAYAARKMNKALGSDIAKQNLALEKEVQQMTGDLDFSFSLGELTANPFMLGLETSAGKFTQREAQNRRMNTLTSNLRLAANRMSQGGNADQITIQLGDTIIDMNKALNKRASENFAAGMRNVVTAYGDAPIVDGRHYLSGIRQLIAEFSDPELGSTEAPKFLIEQARKLDADVYPAVTLAKAKPTDPFVVALRRDGEELGQFNTAEEAAIFLENYNDVNGGLTAETVDKLLRSFNRIADGSVPTFEGAPPGSARNLANALRVTMMEGLEGGGRKSPEATEAITSLRKIYQFDMAQIRGNNNALLKDIFVQDGPIDPDIAFDMLVRRGPEAQRATVRVLEELDEFALLGDIQAVGIRRAVNRAQDTSAPTSIGMVSPARLASQLENIDKVPGEFGRGLYPSAVSRDLARTGRALRTLNETYGTLFNEAASEQIQQTTINVVSRAPEFFARFLASQFISSNRLARMLNDPAYRQSMITLAEKGLGSKPSQAAIIYMAIKSSEMLAQEEDERRQQVRQNIEEVPGGP